MGTRRLQRNERERGSDMLPNVSCKSNTSCSSEDRIHTHKSVLAVCIREGKVKSTRCQSHNCQNESLTIDILA